MPHEALGAALLELPQVNRRLRLDPQNALNVLADDDTLLIHLEQRPGAGSPPRRLTAPMAPDRLLALLDGMGLGLDLDRGLAPSPSLSGTPAPSEALGPEASASGRTQDLR